MKKSVVGLLLFLFTFSSIIAQDNGLQFKNLSYEEALKVAAKENKLVFLHGYAEWCHYCHDMVEKIYPDSTVGAFFNSNFICIKMDLEKEGAQLNKRLKSHTFPTLVFFDGNGTIMHRAAGRHMKPMLLELGKEALDPKRRLHTWEQLFNNGNCGADTAYRYLRKMEMTATNYQPEALKYLSKLSDADIKSASNWKIVNDLYKDVDAPFTMRLIKMKTELENLYTKPVVERKFFEMYKYEFGIRIRTLDTAGYERLKQQLNVSGFDMAPKIMDYADLMKSKMKGDYALYFKLAEPFVNNYAMSDAVMLNEFSQVFFERTKDPVLLAKAEAWAKESVKLNDSYSNNETLTGILILSGKKEEARTVANHAIELGEKNKINVQKVKIYLEKIEEME